MLRVGLLALGHMWAKENLPHDVRRSFDQRKGCVPITERTKAFRTKAC
jgi:hypothetical protein